VLGRILLQHLPEGRGTHLSYEVAGDPEDPRTAQRRAIFEPLGLEIARYMEESPGPTPALGRSRRRSPSRRRTASKAS
jgi:hypothetical protein